MEIHCRMRGVGGGDTLPYEGVGIHCRMSGGWGGGDTLPYERGGDTLPYEGGGGWRYTAV